MPVSDGVDDISCNKYRPKHEYTHIQEFIDNLPYMLMTAFGAIILFLGIKSLFWSLLAAGLFIFWGILGTIWFIIFICPYCHFYDTRACPCGYGQFAAKVRPKAPIEQFNEKFKRHIPIIFPLWFIPLIAGGIFLYNNFSILMFTFIILFTIDSFILLPLISRKYGCAHCPQKESCPWMTEKKTKVITSQQGN